MNNFDERTLTVINFGTDEDDEILKTRVTIPLQSVEVMIASNGAYKMVDGMEIAKVNILFTSNNNIELFVSMSDLSTLERAIGAYFLP